MSDTEYLPHGIQHKEVAQKVAAMIDKYNLEARWVCGLMSTEWEEHVRRSFFSTEDGQNFYAFPYKANRVDHLFLITESEIKDDGVHVTIEYYESEDRRIPPYTVVLPWETVTYIEVRGLKRNLDPKRLFLTCNGDNWEEAVEKELRKLTRIQLTTKEMYRWYNIEDRVQI
ncbi:hypothetical protein [Vibrio phage vB_VmeM-Yong XC32]|nr:hypothetical protein [Vibrio phage vB_VmeM-Yong XC31]QAX96491.1 hypothetical protein [Vibrio phage vB_VmeM-Yong XC32]QAX96808.1 hypothetical protein [Vibrio phage vB_VmeM-Yong MS31]QAX97127.1 hypothetical protein [Vibrio phage vB_VmeM-Yong MS32]